MRVELVSGNPHKARELAAVLPGWDVAPMEVDALPEETGASYYDNARAKARFGRMVGEFDVWMLADDSGLEVDALDGRPGIGSARYAAAGDDGLAKLLGELSGVAGEKRRARYVCELVLLSPELEEFRGSGVLEGTVAEEARGSEGFGYDPVFIPAGEGRTVAELGDAWKARSSHRAQAAAALAEAVEASGAAEE